MQALLLDEATQPLVLNALRGQRARMHEEFEAGQVPPGDPSRQRGLRGLVGGFGALCRIRTLHAQLVQTTTECVEIAKLPDEAQRIVRLRRSAVPGSHWK